MEDYSRACIDRENTTDLILTGYAPFFDHFFPLPREVLDLIREVQQQNVQPWNTVPQDPKDEASIYVPFVETANRVLNICKPKRDACLQTEWFERSEHPPKFVDYLSPLIRPDILAVLPGKSMDSFKKLDTETSGYEPGQEEEVRFLEIWWNRVVAPVEVRLNDTDGERTKGCRRLFTCMRSVLREQLDRRFVFGLLLMRDKLYIYVCDRAGVMGTEEGVDIHQNPEVFIQVILALSYLDPCQLGWDMGMRILQAPNDGASPYRFLHSTHPDITIEDYQESISATRWAIFVPDHHALASGTWYLTVHPIRLYRPMFAAGKATTVWMVVALKEGLEREQDNARVLVLKQSWDIMNSPLETEFCPEPVEHVCEIVKCVRIGFEHSPVAVDGKHQEISTVLLRGDVTPHPPIRNTPAGGSRHYLALYGETESDPDIIHRVLTRTLMKTYGWTIEYFLNLTELVTVIRDAIRGHRELYFRGVIHRDISFGNILICPEMAEDGSMKKTYGCLIDLDNAKKAEKCIQYPPLDDSIDDQFLKLFQEMVDLDAPGAARALLTRFNNKADLVSYALSVLKTRFEPEQKLAMISHLTEQKYADLRDRPPPSWAGQEPNSEGFWRGTPLFMSAEAIFPGNPYTSCLLRTDLPMYNVPHSAIHDLESFFWVLLYLCLTREGPGRKRRTDLTGDLAEARKLQKTLDQFFEAETPTLSRSRKRLFNDSSILETELQPYFHPYFDRLKPLVRDWWALLQLGYNVYDDVMQGSIHDGVLNLLEKTLEELDTQSSHEAEKQAWEGFKQEEEQRKIRIARLKIAEASLEQVSPGQSQFAAAGTVIEPSSPTPTRPAKRPRLI